MWCVTIAPYCWSANVPELAVGSRLALRLSGDPTIYVANELMGVVQQFRARLRLARSLVILLRGGLLSVLILLLARFVDLAFNLPLEAWVPLVLFLVVGWSIHLALHHAISPFEVARLVDHRLGLNAQVATAVEHTLDNRLDKPFVRLQVRQATQRVRGIDPGRAIPLVIPARDIQLLALAIVLYAGTLVIGSLGSLGLPTAVQPIDAAVSSAATQSAQAPSAYVTVVSSQIPPQALATAQAGGVPGNDFAQQASALRQQYDSHAITQEQYQQQLQQLAQQIQQQSNASLAAQQALNSLASALKDNSSTNDVSNALLNGNYPQATEGLRNLSQQLGQLSPDAQQQLAKQLQQAAASTQQTDSDISKSAAAAAQSLQNGDQAQAAQSMQQLAQAVQQASDQIAAQSQLGQSLQDVQQQMSGASSGTPQSQASPTSDQSGAAQQQQGTGADGQSSADQSSAASGDQGGQPGSQQGTDGGSDSGSLAGASGSSSITSIQQDGNGNSGGVGNGPGGPALGGQQNALDVNGQKLTIIGKDSGQGTTTTTTGDRSIPLTASDGSTIAGAGGAGGSASNVPIKVHDTSNAVPLNRQSVVREYFSNGQ
ncbi:MAG TPA: hypothetical protein VFZ25_13410 [Chloroflexota bacterium]|nr:hypothetical protein [Chloroflexota bacterium]